MRRPLLAVALTIGVASFALAQRDQAPEPPWRAGALALVPQGYVAGAAYRTDGNNGRNKSSQFLVLLDSLPPNYQIANFRIFQMSHRVNGAIDAALAFGC